MTQFSKLLSNDVSSTCRSLFEIGALWSECLGQSKLHIGKRKTRYFQQYGIQAIVSFLLISVPSLGLYYCQQIILTLSVCPSVSLSVTLLQIASSSFVSRWNRAIFCPSFLHNNNNHHHLIYIAPACRMTSEAVVVVVDVVVVVVMTSPSGTAYMGGQRGPEEMRNSTRL